jgi:hypothetical protein
MFQIYCMSMHFCSEFNLYLDLYALADLTVRNFKESIFSVFPYFLTWYQSLGRVKSSIVADF